MYGLPMENNKSELTIEDVKEDYALMYDRTNNMTKIKLKCWLSYNEFVLREEPAGTKLMSFDNYTQHMNASSYLHHVEYGTVNCDDLGGIEAGIKVIKTWYGMIPKKDWIVVIMDGETRFRWSVTASTEEEAITLAKAEAIKAGKGHTDVKAVWDDTNALNKQLGNGCCPD